MATSGHRRSVDSMMICETSQGSSWLLSVNTRAPSCPASSLARANSCSSRTHLSGPAWAETGHEEKIFKPRSEAGIGSNGPIFGRLKLTRRKLRTMIVGNPRHLLHSAHDRASIGLGFRLAGSLEAIREKQI